mgnify:CR=1 FL=1
MLEPECTTALLDPRPHLVHRGHLSHADIVEGVEVVSTTEHTRVTGFTTVPFKIVQECVSYGNEVPLPREIADEVRVLLCVE